MSGSNQTVDSLDSLLDFSEFDAVSSYQSPSLSPEVTAKTPFARPASTVTTPVMPHSTQPQLSGPSHQYELYKQQTGLVPGALASTLAVNQNSQISGYTNYNLDLLSAMSPENDFFDFNTAPSQASLNDMDMDFDSPATEPSFLFPETINPTAIVGQESPSLPSPPVLPTQTSNVGRMYPGMHSQAALAKAQAQQRQQQQIIMQQRQHAQAKPRAKSSQPNDPIVEQKITQLLNSMRAKPAGMDDSQTPLLNVPRPKKDEDDMDEDEKLLASEEGKKLSSKERRQLRNKVSARAFRSRRKEYITQLEAEIANKVTDNNDLRTQNRALMEENKRLSDLTRMLLSSPSFSNFLDNLSANPAAVPQQPVLIKAEPRAEQQARQVPKDVNPYAAAQQISMAMIPEQPVDFSVLNLEGDAFAFQPQVFAVLDTPELPAAIDASVLSGKTSNFVGSFESDDDKIEVPVIDRLVAEKTTAPAAPEAPVDEAFERDPAFALYHSPAAEEARDEEEGEDIFAGIEPEKLLARYELVDAAEEERNALLSMARIQRITASLDAMTARLERLMM